MKPTYPKLPIVKTSQLHFRGTVSEMHTYECKTHGLQFSVNEDGTCSNCNRTCPGCGEEKDSMAMEAALAGVGRKFNVSDKHAACNERTQSFWMEKEKTDEELASDKYDLDEAQVKGN